MKKSRSIIILLTFIMVLTSTAVFADQIELQNGQKLRGEIRNDSLRLQTAYAELNLQSRYINKINRENGRFVIRASENNRFSGQLLTDIVFAASGGERVFSASEIKTVDFSESVSFSDNGIDSSDSDSPGNNKRVSITLRNGDFFFGRSVENSISINTSLGSPLNISYNKMSSIQYLSEENIYLIKRNNTSDIKSDLSGQKIIIWPAAGEIIELEFNYVDKINFE